ncbi:hypothetical protein U9M48_001652 [Paspalum notatum var. saurae]|uniref:HMA domain-containing protein n=1 Tax=Paspalum notatum var. saurae TaxID=547442 RepID=A0AAQ3PG34_PASNO
MSQSGDGAEGEGGSRDADGDHSAAPPVAGRGSGGRRPDVAADFYGKCYSLLLQQKIVLKVSMSCERCRSMAMTLVAKSDGISSVAITGDGKDRLEVVGAGIDAICLLKCLRNKLGQAELMQIEIVKQQQKTVEPSEEGQERMGDGNPGGVVSGAARQQGRSHSSSEVTGQDKPEDDKVGARKSKKGWPMMACRVLWRQLRRGNKSVAAKKAQRR